MEHAVHKGRKTDRRIERTKAVLYEGLAALLQTKPLKDITVKELVRVVDINRSTFYLHYADLSCLVTEMEEILKKQIINILEEYPVETTNSTQPVFTNIYRVFAENRVFCTALMGENGDGKFLNDIETIIGKYSVQMINKIFRIPEKELSYITAYCLRGTVGLAAEWLKKDIPESPEYMAELNYKLIYDCFRIYDMTDTEGNESPCPLVSHF